MTTYIVLNLLFMLSAFVLLPLRRKVNTRAWWRMALIVVVLTLVFDPVIVGLSIVAYDPAKLLGVSFFGAPIEDVCYAIYAAAVVPLVWYMIGSRRG